MKTVLVVDDQEEIRKLLRITLDEEDVRVLTSTFAAEGIELTRNEKPDVILMDVMMPGEMDGLEATRIIKNDPETCLSFLMLLTSKAEKEDIEKGYEAGADDYMVKPFSPRELLSRIKQALG